MTIYKIGFIAAVSAIISITGCTSNFKPSPRAKTILNSMNKSEAAEVINTLMRPRYYNDNSSRSFVTGYIGLGMCKANEFSLDEQKGPDVQVTAEDINFNAIRSGKVTKSTSGSKISTAAGMTTVNQYEHIPYREHLRFDKIEVVLIHEPNLLRTICNRQNDQSEVIIRDSTTRWYAALIPTAENDRFIAALLRLRPDIKITTDPENFK